MQYKFLLATVFLFLGVASNNVAAENLDDAVDAMHRGDFAKAYCIMRPLAEAGDAESQYNIGWMYLNGYGLRVDDRRALEWWTQASEQGHTDASFSIGMLYSLGEGKVPKDLNRAIDFYLVAAEDGQEDAIKLLQYMMMRNDQEIRGRLHSIINQNGTLFGIPMQVTANKLNARQGPSTKEKVVTRLLNGQPVLEIFKKGKWSQVVVLGEEKIDQTVWVSNRFLEKPEPIQDSEEQAGSVESQVATPVQKPLTDDHEN
ncbi:MAG: SH3 domain-containing protein [Gammaproteobacteria bacterium]